MTQFDIRIITNSEDGETRVSSLGDLVSALGLGGLEKVFTDLHSSEVTGTETQGGLGSKNDLRFSV
ncbi:MAG: hypothetical protein QG623_262 [Patescibacteria group bacterium]|nr:hypothetical protein [Patescibacteria group bacterium]